MSTTESQINRKHSRRKAERYSHGDIFVFVKRRDFFARFQKPKSVTWMDFNRYGIAFLSDQRYALGSELEIELSSNDTGMESLSGIIGVITNIRIESENYRCGVQFNYEANDFMKSDAVKQSMITIENRLKSIISFLNDQRKH